MGLTRTLLRPAARIAALHAGAQLGRFLRAHRRSRQVQDALLARLVAEHAETRFGRDHVLSAVKSYDDFRRAVPLGDYQSLLPYLQAVYEGDTEALFPRGVDVLMFALTSGTTGQPKRIPVTRASLDAYRRGWNIFGLQAFNDHPDAWLRKILQITSPATESFSPAGKPCGAISGLLAQTQKRIVRRMYPLPAAVLGIADCRAKYYTIMRLAMPEDVTFISTANPSTIVQMFAVASECLDSLLRDLHDGTLTAPGEVPAEVASRLRLRRRPTLARRIERAVSRDGQLLSRHFWNLSLRMHWTGGTLGLYAPAVQAVTSQTPVRDIGLLASEGRFSVPLADGTAAGVADITAAFLEFIPADQADSPQPTVLRSHELEVGGEYFLVFTNFAGLWRYNIQDRIRVTGHLEQSPVFEFLSKGRHTVNLTGEKLTEHQVVRAVEQACAARRLRVTRFIAQPHFAAPPYYALTIEADAAPPTDLAGDIDRALQALNIEYAGKRHSGRLGILRLDWLDSDHFDRRERQILTARNGRNEQYKHQYLLTDIVTDGGA